ncbi:MAG: hypothetical protein QOH21_692, partial [Acidobacteriota bacterium]|nr:hypothetical protein [Acidobacteriota bacterium]
AAHVATRRSKRESQRQRSWLYKSGGKAPHSKRFAETFHAYRDNWFIRRVSASTERSSSATCTAFHAPPCFSNRPTDTG